MRLARKWPEGATIVALRDIDAVSIIYLLYHSFHKKSSAVEVTSDLYMSDSRLINYYAFTSGRISATEYSTAFPATFTRSFSRDV